MQRFKIARHSKKIRTFLIILRNTNNIHVKKREKGRRKKGKKKKKRKGRKEIQLIEKIVKY
jgi:hypothetical protein